MTDARPPRALVGLAVTAGLGLAIVCLVVWGLGADALSPWGYVEALLATGLAASLVSTPWRGVHRRFGPTRGLALAVLVLLLVRVVVAGGGDRAAMRVLPGDGSARWVGRLFEERDAAVLGARLVAGSVLTTPEAPTLSALLDREYARFDADAPRLGTPIVATYLGWQTPDAFDVVRFEGPSETAVVFLHGSAGAFALWCWEIAHPLRDVATTWCPSTGPAGDWWSDDGESIARTTIDAARSAGTEHVVLAGLSNGGRGAARLAPRLGDEIDGLVLVSGLDARAPIPDVPILVVHGRDDGHFPFDLAQAYVERAGDRAELVLFDATHFLLVEGPDELGAAIAAFVRRVTER